MLLIINPYNKDLKYFEAETISLVAESSFTLDINNNDQLAQDLNRALTFDRIVDNRLCLADVPYKHLLSNDDDAQYAGQLLCKLVNHITGDQRKSKHVLGWLAKVIRREHIDTALYLSTKHKGMGKGTLAYLLRQVIDQTYILQINDIFSYKQDHMFNHLNIFEEINASITPTGYQKIKDAITAKFKTRKNTSIPVNPAFMFCSNGLSTDTSGRQLMPIGKDPERRLCVIHNDKKKDADIDEFCAQMHRMLTNHDQDLINACFKFLYEYDTSNFNAKDTFDQDKLINVATKKDKKYVFSPILQTWVKNPSAAIEGLTVDIANLKELILMQKQTGEPA